MFDRSGCGYSALCLTAIGMLWMQLGVAHADLLIRSYQDRLHDPFYVGADKAFIGAAYNWSGVGRIPDPAASGINWKTVAMISDNYFITAFHNQPNRGDDPGLAIPKVRFYRTTDPNGQYWESEIAIAGNKYDGQRIGLTDLWVGKLASTPPDWVMRYPLAKRHEATNYLSYTDNKLFIFGQDSPRNWTSVRVGRNEIDQVDISGNYTWDFDAVGGLGADEAETQLGDSGAPSFFVDGRIPVLAGVHTRVNFDTGVSANLEQILSAVGETISFSTGLFGDVNADFRTNSVDFDVILANYGRRSNVRLAHGDLNGDGVVGADDYFSLAHNFGKSLYAPADFNKDGNVDAADLIVIANNWNRFVSSPFADGDANGNWFVSALDVKVFDDNQFRAAYGPLPLPLAAVAGDLNGNGVVDGFDLSIVTSNLNQVVIPGTRGDTDHNGIVNNLDLAYVSLRLGDSFGDINGDHVVGTDDFVVLMSNWKKTVSNGRLGGDFNGDRFVDDRDIRILFDWWGQENGEFPGMMVPEPASFVLSAISCYGLLWLVRRRRCVGN